MPAGDWNEDNFLEKLASAPSPQAMAAHRAACPECRDLARRLERFDDPPDAGLDAGWQQTEARLDSWLENFLPPHRTAGRRARRTWSWALAAAATIALIAGAFVAGRVSVPRPAPARAVVPRASRPSPPQPILAEAVPMAPRTPARPIPPTARPAAPGRATPPAAPVPDAPAPVSVTVPVVPARELAPQPAAKAEPRRPIPATPAIRLDAGTRVWIALKSVRPLGNGESRFRGVVLLPVRQSGTVLLGRNTEVFGHMTLTNGKRSVKILEFLSPEAHYTLRGASGVANLRLLGAGEVVEFDAGRVLETWMESGSTYERTPGESRPPE